MRLGIGQRYYSSTYTTYTIFARCFTGYLRASRALSQGCLRASGALSQDCIRASRALSQGYLRASGALSQGYLRASHALIQFYWSKIYIFGHAWLWLAVDWFFVITKLASLLGSVWYARCRISQTDLLLISANFAIMAPNLWAIFINVWQFLFTKKTKF